MVNCLQTHKIINSLTFVNLVTPKAGAKHELLLNKPSSGELGVCSCDGHWSAQGRTWAHRGVKHLRGMERAWAWSLQGHIGCKGMGPTEAWNVEERGA